MAHCHRMVGFCCREQRKNTTAPILCALLLWCVCIPTLGSRNCSEQQKCDPGEYCNEGVCCNKCSQGFRLTVRCQAAGQRTICSPCPTGQYIEQMNYSPNCRSCKRCRVVDFEEEVSECKKEHNTVCRCQSGFYKDVINLDTSQCLRCSKCRVGTRQSEKCSSEHDTVCECEKDFYPMQNKCLPCKNCADEKCKIHCPSLSSTIPKPLDVAQVLGAGTCVLVVLLVVVGLITYMATKRHTKSKLVAKGEASQAPKAPKATLEETAKILIHSEERSFGEVNMALPCSRLSEQELTRLPDCIPLEINIPELIYSVLDLVPATRVKELVRGLGVTDVEIERVGLDHRMCKEAHYQMLRVWAERETRGGGVLHRPLMQALLDRLGDMHLGGAVEELETKYGIVGGQVGAVSLSGDVQEAHTHTHRCAVLH